MEKVQETEFVPFDVWEEFFIFAVLCISLSAHGAQRFNKS